MKTALLFAGIMFPLLVSMTTHNSPWDMTAITICSVGSVAGMVMIFFSGRYEAAAVFYLAVAMSNMKATMLPPYFPLSYMTMLAYFMVAMYLTLYVLGRKAH